MRLILDAVDDGLADDRLPHNQFISRFNTFAGDAYRVCCTLVVEIVDRRSDSQHVKHIRMIVSALAVQDSDIFFRHESIGIDRTHFGMVDRTKRLPSYPDIHLLNTGIREFVLQLQNKSFDTNGCLRYIVDTPTLNT